MRDRWGELKAPRRWDPAKNPEGWGTPCWRCEDRGRLATCPWCGGKGHLVFTTPLADLLTDDVDLAVDVVRMEEQAHALPVVGGTLDQAHVYTHLRAVVRGEWAACEGRYLDRSRED